MAIKTLNKKVTGATTSAAFGPVPAGKEWIIKLIASEIVTGGATASLTLEVDGVAVAKDDSIGALGEITNLVGGSGANIIPENTFATDGQSVSVIRGSGGGFTFDAHMSYLERDIPT